MGLSREQIDEYQREGFLRLEKQFSVAEIDLLLAELPSIFAEDSPRKILEKSGSVRSVFAPHTTSEIFAKLGRLRRLVAPAMELLDSEVYIHQFKINAKRALDGDQWEWHQDYLYWYREDGMSSPLVLTAAIFLQDVSEFNGPMLLIPRSHKNGMLDVTTHGESLAEETPANSNGQDRPWMSTLSADLKYKIDRQSLARSIAEGNMISIKGPAGLVLFFHGNLLHASANNLSVTDRISVFITYNSVQNKLDDVKTARPTFIASRDFRALVPLDDGALLAHSGTSSVS